MLHIPGLPMGCWRSQADGCLLVKTKQAVLVAEYVAPVQQAEAVKIVEGLADYLISVGY
jgi:profilin